MKHQTVYVPVSVLERLPEKLGFYNCYFGRIKTDNEKHYTICELKEVDLGFKKVVMFDPKVTHWLEPIPNVYLFSEEELRNYVAEKIVNYIETRR